MSDREKGIKAKEIAEFLEVSGSTAYDILGLMEIRDIVQKVTRGGRMFYFLKGVYDDEQISSMLPEKVKRVPKRRKSVPRIPKKPRVRGEIRKKSMFEEHLSAVRAQASSGEGLSALAIIGLDQQYMAEDIVLEEELSRALDMEPEVEEIKVVTPIISKPIMSTPFGTVKYLPKDVRRLTIGQTRHLKEQLKWLEGYDSIDMFNTVFARLSALEIGKYGNVLYFSTGSNSWDNIQKVTIDPSISDFMVLPVYGKDQYEKIIDQFMESGHELVEITVENRGAQHVKNMLNKRIEERGLEEQVKASHVGEWIYLEKTV